MKMTLMAIIKTIKDLEEQKKIVLSEENTNCKRSYVSDKDKIETGYNYAETRNTIKKLDDKILNYRSLLNRANTTIIVDDFNLTINEALIKLAQMSAELNQLNSLPTTQSSRMVTYNGTIEYTDCLFDVNEVKKECTSLRKKISDLQMAIDKTNLTHEIDA